MHLTPNAFVTCVVVRSRGSHRCMPILASLLSYCSDSRLYGCIPCKCTQTAVLLAHHAMSWQKRGFCACRPGRRACQGVGAAWSQRPDVALVQLQVHRTLSVCNTWHRKQPRSAASQPQEGWHSSLQLERRCRKPNGGIRIHGSGGALSSLAALAVNQGRRVSGLTRTFLSSWPATTRQASCGAATRVCSWVAVAQPAAASGAAAATFTPRLQRRAPSSCRMQAEQRTMPGSKVHDMQPGGFAVRAISTLQAEDRMDSFSSSTGAAARQLPVALITTTGCQFCNQVRALLPPGVPSWCVYMCPQSGVDSMTCTHWVAALAHRMPAGKDSAGRCRDSIRRDRSGAVPQAADGGQADHWPRHSAAGNLQRVVHLHPMHACTPAHCLPALI